MQNIIMVSDVDLSKESGAGIALYIKNFIEKRPKEISITLIGKNKNNHIYQADRFIEICNTKSNYQFFLNLMRLDKSFIDKDSIIISNRPDFLYPFRKARNKKIIILHGNPSEIIMMKKGILTHLMYSYLERISLKAADKVIFVDPKNRDKYIVKYAWLINKTEFIPTGVDTEKFKPINKTLARKTLNIAKSPKILLFVGRLEPEKQIIAILKEFIQLRNQNYRMIVLGNGSLFGRVKEFEHVDNRIKVYKDIKHDKVPLYMNASDALVIMSLSEGFPNVVLEALACKLPIIATDVGGISEVVHNGKTGYLEDIDGLETAFQRILLNHKSFSKNCFELSKKYSWTKILPRLLKCIQV